jgi:hypothetical protein
LAAVGDHFGDFSFAWIVGAFR